MLRIGIDARPLARGQAGISRVAYSTVRELERLDGCNQYYLYCNRPFDLPFENPRWQKTVQPLYSLLPGSLWLQSRAFARAARHDGLDVFWGTSFTLPAGLPAATQKVLSIYDLVWRRYPQSMSWYNRVLSHAFAERSIGRADVILTISESTKQDLESELRVPAEKIRVMPLGVDAHFRPSDPALAARRIAQKYGCSENYILSVGTIEPRKNLALLIDAIGILKGQGKLAHQLVVAGAKGWGKSRIAESTLKWKLTARDVKFLGFIPEEDLPLLYSGAALFVFPSVYEGFGLPLVEAMACGVAVVASNTSSIPEVVEDAACLVSPYDSEAMAAGIVRLLSDTQIRLALIERGLKRAQGFTWEATARTVLHTLTGEAL
jgi:glycosyltransferase involved in cell wall biosynthesis